MYIYNNKGTFPKKEREKVSSGLIYGSGDIPIFRYVVYQGSESLKLALYLSRRRRLARQVTINRTKKLFRVYVSKSAGEGRYLKTRQYRASELESTIKILHVNALSNPKNTYLFKIYADIVKFATANSEIPCLTYASDWNKLSKVDKSDIKRALKHTGKRVTLSAHNLLYFYRKEKKGVDRIFWEFLGRLRPRRTKESFTTNPSLISLRKFMEELTALVPIDYIRKLFLEDLTADEIASLSRTCYYYMYNSNGLKDYEVTIDTISKYMMSNAHHAIHCLLTLKKTYKHFADVVRTFERRLTYVIDTYHMLNKKLSLQPGIPEFQNIEDLHDKLQEILRISEEKDVAFNVPDVQFEHGNLIFTIPKNSKELKAASKELSNCLSSSPIYKRQLMNFNPALGFVMIGKSQTGEYKRAIEVRITNRKVSVIQNSTIRNQTVPDSDEIADKIKSILHHIVEEREIQAG